MNRVELHRRITWWIFCGAAIPLIVALLLVGVGAFETQRYIGIDSLTAHLDGTNLAFFAVLSLATLWLTWAAAAKTTKSASNRETALAWLVAVIGGVLTLVNAESAYQNICLQGAPCFNTPYGPKIPFLIPSLLLVWSIGYCFVLFSRSFVLFILKDSRHHGVNG
jgi:hypothetical protein